jgi:hypothetical protein
MRMHACSHASPGSPTGRPARVLAAVASCMRMAPCRMHLAPCSLHAPLKAPRPVAMAGEIAAAEACLRQVKAPRPRQAHSPRRCGSPCACLARSVPARVGRRWKQSLRRATTRAATRVAKQLAVRVRPHLSNDHCNARLHSQSDCLQTQARGITAGGHKRMGCGGLTGERGGVARAGVGTPIAPRTRRCLPSSLTAPA